MYDPQLAMSLKYNIAEFSAFKELSFRKQLESIITENGKVVSWSNFKNKARELNIVYNNRWLRTEYDQTVATANMAEKWQGFVREKDLYPNLKYLTIGDGRVREKHKGWHGLILPITHHFWQENLPPNDFGCRCTAIQTDEDPTVDIPNIQNKKGFNNNAGVSGKIFKDIPYAEGLSDSDRRGASEYAKEKFDDLTLERKVMKEFKNGGKITSSNLVDAKASDYRDLFRCCTHFAKVLGKTAEILPRINSKSPLYKELFGGLTGTKYDGKCPDLKVGDLYYELEGFEGSGTNKLSKMLTRGVKQSSRLILLDDGSSLNHLLKLINFRIKKGQVIEEVWILRANGKLDRVY